MRRTRCRRRRAGARDHQHACARAFGVTESCPPWREHVTSR
jgi:hypothetical protein